MNTCTEEAMPVGTRLELLFPLPEGEIRVLAVVRSFTTGRGIGVEFVSREFATFYTEGFIQTI